MGKRKVFVIGLDGATLDLIKVWAHEGKLPTFSRLMKCGVWGELKSTVPPLSPSAWTSAFTGVNPGKHGIFDFCIPDGYRKTLVNSACRGTPAIWELLTKNNMRSIVINVPLTYPPEKINGILISGMSTPNLESAFTYPRALRHQLIKAGYMIDYGSKGEVARNKAHCLQMLDRVAEKRKSLTLDLLKGKWDLFIVVFTSLDRVQHFFWEYMRTKCLKNDIGRRDKYRDVILNFYQKFDGITKELINAVDRNTTVIILSDHGFGSLQKEVYVNQHFLDLGLLHLRKNGRGVLRYLGFRQNVLVDIGRALTRLGLGKIIELLPRSFIQDLISATTTSCIEWSQTKSWFWSYPGQSIRTNLEGREPQGIVKQDEYEDLRNLIIKELLKIKDPKTQKGIVQRIYKTEEIYWGPYVKNAPDLVVETEDGYTCQDGFSKVLIRPSRQGRARISGKHKIKGVFLVYGPEVKRKLQIRNAKIYDVTPTILHLLGLGIPGEADGRVLKEIFREDSDMAKKPIKYVAEDTDSKERERVKQKIKRLKKNGRI